MPCSDKKLEGSRKENVIENDSNLSIKEVDCVITRIEIEQLRAFDGGDGVRTENISERIADSKGSHGYLENVFVAAAKELFGIDLRANSKDLKYEKLRNDDVEELTLALTPQQMEALPFDFKQKSMKRTGTVLHFLRCYGFRNIQNVIRQIERKKSKYHYVESIACSSGCINGGGQIPIDGDNAESKKVSKKKEHIAEMSVLL